MTTLLLFNLIVNKNLYIFSLDATKLLVGFARGQVVEYDMATGKILRDMSDVHPIGKIQYLLIHLVLPPRRTHLPPPLFPIFK